MFPFVVSLFRGDVVHVEASYDRRKTIEHRKGC